MNCIEAFVLGLIQGLTEYLPVSSSGHLAIGAQLFGIKGEDNLTFTIMVHVATVLSNLVILWKEIDWIFRGLFKFEINEETKYVLNIIISMIPVGIVGVFFKEEVENITGQKMSISLDATVGPSTEDFKEFMNGVEEIPKPNLIISTEVMDTW